MTVFICIIIISLIILKPLPRMLINVAMKIEWMKQMIKSVPYRIIPKDEIHIYKTIIIDVPRINEGYNEIARTMSIIAKSIDELRLNCLR